MMLFRQLLSYLTAGQQKSLTECSSNSSHQKSSEHNHASSTRVQMRLTTLYVRRKTKSARRATDLPHEVILNVITKIEFSKETFQSLRLANRTFNDLIIVHKISIVKAIALQQFPVLSLLVRCEQPTVKWLIELRRDSLMAENFLTACARRLRAFSIHSKVLVEPHYKRIALIGLHVLATRDPRSMVRRKVDGKALPFLLDSLPDEVLLCISFVGAIISQALERVVKDEPYQDRHDRFRRFADAFLATNVWSPTWNVVVGPTMRVSERESKILKWAREEWLRWFREGLKIMDNDNGDGEQFSPDLQMKRMVEQVVGKKATRQKLDLAVIEALRADELSEAAIMDLLRSLD